MNMPSDASTDQSNCPSGYYRNTSGMVMQLPGDTPQSPVAAISITDKDALEKLALEELVLIIQKNKGDIKGVQACNVVLDRAKGKPAQAITTVNLNATISETFNIPEEMRINMMRHKIARWEEKQARLALEGQPVVIDN